MVAGIVSCSLPLLLICGSLIPETYGSIFKIQSTLRGTKVLWDFGIVTSELMTSPKSGFGLDKSGKLNIQLEFNGVIANPSPLFISIVSDQQMSSVRQLGNSIDQNPTEYKPSWCIFWATERIYVNPIDQDQQVKPSVNFTFTAPHPDRYHVILSNCDMGSFSLSGQIEFVNPDGNHASLELQPLGNVYLIIAIADGIALATCVLFLILRRVQSRRYHVNFLVVILLKFSYVVFLLINYSLYIKSGTISRSLKLAQWIWGDLLESIQLVFLFFLVSGNRINQSLVSVSEFSISRGLVVLIILLSVFLRTDLCGSPEVCSSVLIMKYAFIFFLLFGSAMILNITLIRLREFIVSSPPKSEMEYLKFHLKLNFFHDLRTAYSMYLLSIPAFFALRSVLSWQSEWMHEVFRLGPITILQFCILVISRPRNPPKDVLFEYIE